MPNPKDKIVEEPTCTCPKCDYSGPESEFESDAAAPDTTEGEPTDSEDAGSIDSILKKHINTAMLNKGGE